MKFTKRSFLSETVRQTLAALTLVAFFSLSITANAQSMARTQTAKTGAVTLKSLTEEQKILHVLNRLGYGARPGEIEKVRAAGIEKYIEQQLNPDKINDSAMEAKLQNLDVLKLSNAELFSIYPNPAAVLQIVAQNNGMNAKQLKGDLKEAKKDRKNGETAMTDDAKMDGAKMPAPQNPDQLSDAERREYQQQIAEIYREKGLGRPQQISQQLNASRILRAVYSERQLQEQMVDFWTNHFNVYANKAAVRWFTPEYDRDVIRPNALGNFRDLLAATAKSPAMLFYLDNFQSVAPNAGKQNDGGRGAKMMERIAQNGGQIPPRMRERLKERGLTDAQIDQRIKQAGNGTAKAKKQERGINENYARELMELHTLGVDGGYTQKDIGEVARAFTGWTIVDPRGYRKAAARTMGADGERAGKGLQMLQGIPANAESGTFYFNARQHDDGEKTVLGQKIKSGGGMNDGLQVIDILMKQPATAKFIARKLAVKFVNDNPSDALVNRIADAFTKSNGDIKTTLRAMFSAPEFFAPENYRAKIKTPFEVLISSMRTLGAETNGNAVQAMLAKMGEPLYGWIAPTGYPDTAEDWVNTGALLERLNFGLALASNRIPGTKVDLSKFAGRDPDDKDKVLNTFIGVVLNNEVSPQTKETLIKQLNQPLPEPKMTAEIADDDLFENAAMQRPNGLGGGKRGGGQQVRLLSPSGNAEVYKIVGLILGSPEFQRQ